MPLLQNMPKCLHGASGRFDLEFIALAGLSALTEARYSAFLKAS